MKKIEYRYSNGTICEHTIYIKPKTIKKECGNSKTVDILEKKHKIWRSGIWKYWTSNKI